MPASPYHHGRLREALVEEAVRAARERGPEGLVLRELARRVGVSHNAAYRHFSDRDALVAAVAGEAQQVLVTAMQDRLDRVTESDPVRRVRLRLAEVGRGYVAFALGEPGLFRTVFGARTAPPGDALLAGGPYGLLGAVLDEQVAAGFLSPQARQGAEVTCWSAVHGFSLLCVEGPLAALPDAERSAVLDTVLLAIDRSYAASTDGDHEPGEAVLAASPVG